MSTKLHGDQIPLQFLITQFHLYYNESLTKGHVAQQYFMHAWTHVGVDQQ